MQIHRPRSILRLAVGTDPGHARLINATAVALGRVDTIATAINDWLANAAKTQRRGYFESHQQSHRRL